MELKNLFSVVELSIVKFGMVSEIIVKCIWEIYIKNSYNFFTASVIHRNNTKFWPVALFRITKNRSEQDFWFFPRLPIFGSLLCKMGQIYLIWDIKNPFPETELIFLETLKNSFSTDTPRPPCIALIKIGFLSCIYTFQTPSPFPIQVDKCMIPYRPFRGLCYVMSHSF